MYKYSEAVIRLGETRGIRGEKKIKKRVKS